MTLLVTFSGLDGSGKSTLIAELKALLERRGRRVRVLTMYDDLTFFSYLRSVRDFLRGGRGRTSPKVEIDAEGNAALGGASMAAWIYQLTRNLALREAVYLLDLLLCRLRLGYHRRIRGESVILDRYFYDSMADIAGVRDRRWYYTAEDARQMGAGRWLYIRLLLGAAPEPSAAFFIDVPPETAFARKQEYPLAYLQGRLEAYKRIMPLARHPVILENRDLDSTKRRLAELADALAASDGGASAP